ncbi:hypothetical protein R4Z09_18405 [Niallia oryzisoli]|uniref:Uncharacterized protein n=1 Tax=Niallia oryzisoli TaxID=1737571 RepID=A0ABZ2C6Y9_9BACI
MTLFTPVAINIMAVKINAVDNGAVVNFGPSEHMDMFVSYKRNQGFGEQNGDYNPILQSYSWVWDMDLLDSLSSKSSII